MRRLRGWRFGLQLNTRVVSAFHRRSLEITVVHLQFFPCLPTTGMFPLGEALLFWTQSACPKEGFSLSWRDRAYASGKADLGVAFSQEWLPVQGVLSWLGHSKSWGLYHQKRILYCSGFFHGEMGSEGAAVILSLGRDSGFWRSPVDPESRDKSWRKWDSY